MPRGSIIIAGGRPPLPPPLKMIGNFMLTKEFFLVFENCIFWAIYKKKSKYLELRGFMSTPKNNFKQEDNFFGIQHTQGDSMALVLSILRFKHRFYENNTLPYAQNTLWIALWIFIIQFFLTFECFLAKKTKDAKI